MDHKLLVYCLCCVFRAGEFHEGVHLLVLFVATHVYHEDAAEFRENLTQVAVGLAVGDLDG